MTFYLQDVSAGKALNADNTLATTVVIPERPLPGGRPPVKLALMPHRSGGLGPGCVNGRTRRA